MNRIYLQTKSSAVVEMGDRLATIDTGRKVGGMCRFLGEELGLHLTQSRVCRGLPPYQVNLKPLNRLATTDMGRKLGRAVPLLLGVRVEARSPSNTVWPGPRPTCIPSGILDHSTVWPQYTKVTDRTDNCPTAYGEPFHKRSPKKSRHRHERLMTFACS